MTIFRSNPENFRGSRSSLTAGMIMYWLLRGFTFTIAVVLGFYILTAFVWIPFHSAEGYTPQFKDRIFQLIGDFLLFVSIVIPHAWTVRRPSLLFRVGLIILAVSWIVIVDIVAYRGGLSTMAFTPHGFIALLVAATLLATLAIQFKRAAEQALVR